MKYILLCLGLLTYFSSAAAPLEDWQELEARRFLKYVLEKNERELIKFAEPSGRYFKGTRLKGEIFTFLYSSQGQWRSVNDIAKMGKLLVKIVKQDDGRIIVIYYPQKYYLPVNADVRFLESEWMRKYFACEFEVRDRRLLLGENFCFAETDGPFPPEY